MILVTPSYEILTKIDGEQILRRIDAAGRTCYKSESLVPAAEFIQKILKKGHESVIEHESVSVRIICDRGVTHEIVRHRLCAYSQESTRYCNYKGGVTFVIPPWVGVKPGEYEYGIYPTGSGNRPDRRWMSALMNTEDDYIKLLGEGWSPQQARSVLPNSLKTEIVMTANIREWRHILRLRTSKAAHPQMREIMIPLLEELQARIPVLFDDLIDTL